MSVRDAEDPGVHRPLRGSRQSVRWIVLICALAAVLTAVVALRAQARIERMPQRPPDQPVPLGPAELTATGLQQADMASRPLSARVVVRRRDFQLKTRK